MSPRRLSLRTRRRVAVGLLLVAALWPGAHHALAREAGFDPWEGFGWAMYALPLPRVQVALRVEVDGEEHELRPTGALRARVQRHARLRTTLGRWAPDEAFAREVLALEPRWEAVTVVLRHWHLDPASARMEVREEALRFARTSG